MTLANTRPRRLAPCVVATLLAVLAAALEPAAAAHDDPAGYRRMTTVPDDRLLSKGAVVSGWAIARSVTGLWLGLGATSDDDVIQAMAGAPERALQVRLFGIHTPDATGDADRLRAEGWAALDQMVGSARRRGDRQQAGGPVVCVGTGLAVNDRPTAVCGSGSTERGPEDFALELIARGLVRSDPTQLYEHRAFSVDYLAAEAEARSRLRGLWRSPLADDDG